MSISSVWRIRKVRIIGILVLANMALACLLTVIPGRPHTSVPVVDLTGKSFTELTRYFQTQAKKEGAAYAFDLLRYAKLPPNTDLHLLGHVVGDELYLQQGINGMHLCTQDFRNACSHSIVVGLYLEKGPAALPEIAEACKKAPGGAGAYTMCFHGLGHGVLAAVNYELPEAVKLCQMTGSAAYEYREPGECVGGAVMEIISGGSHNPKAWETQSKKYLTPDDPLTPCSADYIPDADKPLCYLYLTPLLMMRAGADLGNPEPRYFPEAFSYCSRLPVNDFTNREACYGGFGKEFIVLVREREIRQIADITDQQFATAISWCGMAGNPTGTQACLRAIVQTLYWGGENEVGTAIRFCQAIPDAAAAAECFRILGGAVKFYNPQNPAVHTGFCSRIPETYRRECQAL